MDAQQHHGSVATSCFVPLSSSDPIVKATHVCVLCEQRAACARVCLNSTSNAAHHLNRHHADYDTSKRFQLPNEMRKGTIQLMWKDQKINSEAPETAKDQVALVHDLIDNLCIEQLLPHSFIEWSAMRKLILALISLHEGPAEYPPARTGCSLVYAGSQQPPQRLGELLFF